MATSVQGQALGHKAFSGNGRCCEILRSARSMRAARVRRQIQAAAPKSTGNDVQRGVERFLQKYDVPSAGVGALTVTSYCVWRGQDPVTALSITLAATVAALVINEYFFENKR